MPGQLIRKAAYKFHRTTDTIFTKPMETWPKVGAVIIGLEIYLRGSLRVGTTLLTCPGSRVFAHVAADPGSILILATQLLRRHAQSVKQKRPPIKVAVSVYFFLRQRFFSVGSMTIVRPRSCWKNSKMRSMKSRISSMLKSARLGVSSQCHS